MASPKPKYPARDEWCAGRDWRWRAALLALLVWQAARPLRDPAAWHIFGGVTFGVHEFGHLFFSLFGSEWVAIAGGSLMQLIVPVGAMAAIWTSTRDRFGVAATGTWLAASLADLAPYIADARAQDLDLLSFSEEASGHDWHFLLASAGMLKQDLAVARFARFVAILVLIAVVLVSIDLFLRMRRHAAARPTPGVP